MFQAFVSVLGNQDLSEGFQRFPDRHHLSEDLGTFLAALDHFFDGVDLSGHFPEPVLQGALFFVGVQMHGQGR